MSNVLVPSPPPQWPMPGTMNRRTASRTFFTFVLGQHVLVVFDDVPGRNTGIAPPGTSAVCRAEELREIRARSRSVGRRLCPPWRCRCRSSASSDPSSHPGTRCTCRRRSRTRPAGTAEAPTPVRCPETAARRSVRRFADSSRRCRSCARPPPAARSDSLAASPSLHCTTFGSNVQRVGFFSTPSFTPSSVSHGAITASCRTAYLLAWIARLVL